MNTYKFKGKEYRQLKEISIARLIASDLYGTQLTTVIHDIIHLGYNIYPPIDPGDIIERVGRIVGQVGIFALVSHGYIEEISPKTYSIGQRFKKGLIPTYYHKSHLFKYVLYTLSQEIGLSTQYKLGTPSKISCEELEKIIGNIDLLEEIDGEN